MLLMFYVQYSPRVVHGLDLFVDLIGLDRIWSDNRCLFFDVICGAE